MDDKATVDKNSSDRAAMSEDLQLIDDVRGGLPAMRRRGAVYLPQYEAEGREEYQRRLSAAPWRPEFNDALLTLASKPFSRPVSLPVDAPLPMLKFAQDVDAQGNSLHVFARNIFLDALACGVSLLMIDAPKSDARTMADAKALGLRPYWIHVPISQVVALYTEMRAGRRVITHLRRREFAVERVGFEEKRIEQVRVTEPGRWEVWRRPAPNTPFQLYESGTMLDAGEVHATLFFTGERRGDMLTRPPLLDLAHMQVELFRALSRQDEVLTYAGSPMLSASGVDRPEGLGSFEVGPKRVLFAPNNREGKAGSWSYVQPDPDILKEIREHVSAISQDMQRLGLQPTIDRNGDATATEAALAAAKSHSALEAWALNLKDGLEQALAMTIKWFDHDDLKAIGTWTPTVEVHHDFAADVQTPAEADIVLRSEERGILSRKTARTELTRRGILGPNFDMDAEATELANQQPVLPAPANGHAT